MTRTNNLRRDFRKGSNNGRSMFDLKHCQVETVVDGNGMTIVGAKGNESGNVARRHVCQRGIIVTTDLVDVP
jgi:hypothetical protein